MTADVKSLMKQGFTKAGKERKRCQCDRCGQFVCSEGNGFMPCDCPELTDPRGRIYWTVYPCRECHLDSEPICGW